MSSKRPTTAPHRKPRLRLPAKRKKGRPRFASAQPDQQGSSENVFWLKTLVTIAVICTVVAIGAIRACVNDARRTEAARRQAATHDDSTPVQTAEQPRNPQMRRASRPPAAFSPAPDTPAELSADAPDPSPAECETPPDVAPASATKRPNAQKVVFTDGARIRTRADGTIEVPRTFSYSGAGLKKPFWIYDRQLERSGRIEYEARAEKKARDRWRALYDEASRQESTEASRESCP